MSGAQHSGPSVLTLDQWKGQNNEAGRSAIDDQELYWSENLQPVGPANLVSLRDNGAAIWTASGSLTVTAFYCYIRGGNSYAIVFLSDGSALEITLPGGVATTVAAASTFSAASPYVPRVAAWGNSGILIVSSQTNGYWAWDGTLYAEGDASPSWLNGGTATNMPTGIKGNAVTVYESRAIVADGNKVEISGPSNGATFAAADGGTSFSSSDPFLQVAFMDLQQSSGFLYLFGDSSANALSNLQTSGSPSSTTFYNANVDPQVGHAFALPGVPFGRALCFANGTGVYALLGGAARKISDKMNQLFANRDTGVVPSMGLVSLNGVKCLAVLIKATNVLGTLANYLLLWDGAKWSVATQTKTVLQVSTLIQDSVPQLWGTDGTTLFQCFGGAGVAPTVKLVTKYYPGPDPIAVKTARSAFVDMSGDSVTAAVTVQTDRGSVSASASVKAVMNWLNSSGDAITWTNSSSEDITWTYAGEQFVGAAANGAGNLIGWTVSFTGGDVTLARFLATFDTIADVGR